MTHTNGLVVVGVVAFASLVLSVMGITQEPQEVIREVFGGSAGPEHTEKQKFISGFTQGGVNCLATSTTAAVGTIPNLADNVTCVDYTVNVADVTLTLMASTSAWLPTRVNEMRSLFIRNASTTATADIVLGGGGGINIKGVATSTGSNPTIKTIPGDTGADNYARVDFVRQSDRDVDALVTIYAD